MVFAYKAELSYNVENSAEIIDDEYICSKVDINYIPKPIKHTTTSVFCSLVPRPPLFLSSVCVHNNTWEQKTGEKRRRPGSIHHMSGHKVDVEVRGPTAKTTH